MPCDAAKRAWLKHVAQKEQRWDVFRGKTIQNRKRLLEGLNERRRADRTRGEIIGERLREKFRGEIGFPRDSPMGVKSEAAWVWVCMLSCECADFAAG
jgi:hypothetical protein